MANQMRATLELTAAIIQWWLSELAGLIPPALRRSLTRSKPCLVLAYQGTDIVLFSRSNPNDEYELGRVKRANIQGTLPKETECLASLDVLAEKRYRKWSLIIQITQDLGIRKVANLPLATKEHLAQALKFELDRLTPFKPDDVYFTWRIQDTNLEIERIHVMLEIVPKKVIEPAIDLVSRYRRQIDRIELNGEGGGYQLIDLRPQKERRLNFKNILLGITTFTLLLIAVYLPVRQQKSVVDDLKLQVAEFRDQAMESLELREQLEFSIKEAEFLADARSARRTMTELLAELTHILPTDSHILQLTIAESSIELLGLADKASNLVALLDRSPILSTPRFKSPITRDTQSKKERFHILTDLVARDH